MIQHHEKAEALGMAESFTYDVFLSHNRQDKPRVQRLAERLHDGGLRVWLDD